MEPNKQAENRDEQDVDVADGVSDQPGDVSEDESGDEVEALANELAAAVERADRHRDEAIRAVAELDNVRKRSARDVEHARKFGLERIMADLLDVSDSLERGLQAAETGQVTVEQLIEGKTLTLRQLKSVLSRHGLQELDPQGEKFNPDHHEAISMVPTSEQAPDTIVDVIQKGYLLNERLLRPARVIVAKAES